MKNFKVIRPTTAAKSWAKNSALCFVMMHLFSQSLVPAVGDDRTALIDGVQEIALPGVVGSLAVYGPDAFVVASAPVSDSLQTPVIAAGNLKKGRIVAFGHNGYLSAGAMDKGQTGRLISMLMLWSAHRTPADAKSLRVGVYGVDSMLSVLSKAGLSGRKLTGNWNSELADLDVVLCEPRSLKTSDVPALLKFVESGHGLMMAASGWVWNGYTAKKGEQIQTDFPGNQIAAKAGIVWESRSARTASGELIPVSRVLPPGLHAGEALQLLKPNSNASAAENKQAAETVIQTVASVPPDDPTFIPEARTMLAEFLGTTVIPQHRQPVRAANVLGRLQVAMETRLALSQPQDAPKSSSLSESFPGRLPDNAMTTRKTIEINTTIPRWHSTGLYANPGALLTVTIPKAAAEAGLTLRIGAHKDKLWEKDAWQRAPEVTRTFPLTTIRTTAGSAFGGLVYIEVPSDCSAGTVSVEIDGAAPAPLYVHGATSPSEWKARQQHPAPWAELASDRFIITLPSEAVRQLDNPGELMEYWNSVLDTCADLAMRPFERSSPERFVIDVQISAGYMHAGYPIMAPMNLAQEVTDLATLKSKGNWGVYHEIGHNHQEPEWTWEGLGEVTVNLFSMYVYDTLNPGAMQHGMVQPDSLAKIRRDFDQSGKLEGPWPQLVPYIELQRNFGWQPFKTVFEEYRNLKPGERPKSLQEKKDQWLIRFSKAVGHNLGPFYDDWKIGMSDAAKAEVSSLPVWKPNR
ncbi:MAG: M60 family metallopeptidase [Planctomycetaceae bacterium]|nr:M60 family metallopeptidase [Planctomycetaceae bacterium]